MLKKISPYRLGIDLGTNSLGFALVALNNTGLPQKPLHMGVRIFSDGRDPKSGSSLAVDRRTARGMRRRRDRLVRRKQQLIEILIEYGLMPSDKKERKKLELFDPYELRAKGLDEKLTPQELGRTLFHLNQRRGFQSNRKQAADDKEAGAVNDAAKTLEKLLAEHHCRTYGEFLAKNPTKRVRNISEDANKVHYEFYPLRDMLKAEYDALLKAQQAYHPELLTTEKMKTLKDIIFHQRPLRPTLKGKCSLLPEEERAYAALPSSQYFRILKDVNNLRTLDRLWRRNRDDLTDGQREKTISELYKKKNISFDGLRKTLKLDSSVVFNLESENRTKLQGALTSIELSKKERFGELWHTLGLAQQDEVVARLLDDRLSDKELRQWLQYKFSSLDEQQILSIMNVSLEDGTLRYSTRAINYLLPHLQDSENEYEAREACKADGLFPHARAYDGQILATLPYYGELLETHVAFGTGSLHDPVEKRYGKIANPTVHIALNQLRKLLNELIQNYGRPQEIAIELSRDLKLNKKEKARLEKEIRDNTKQNEIFDGQIREAGSSPNSDSRLRLKLLQQQKNLCAYSGKTINVSDALSAKCEIDHILPFSRTMDDTTANKVLVLREYNRIKSDKSPFEAKDEFQRAGVNYDDLLARNTQLPGSKKWRFLEDAMKRFEEENNSGDKGWLARQLNDTSYMARVARDYLRYITGNVDTYPGGMTAKLRHAWGFNSLLNSDGNDKKNRDDHRHHAIDALVIACANRSMLQRISTASGRGEELNADWTKDLLNNAPPYTEFNRQALEKAVDSIVISHKPDHKTPGEGGSGNTSARLHEDTFYGLAHNQEELKDGQTRLVTREPLKRLKEKDIENICDPVIRQKLEQALYERDANEKAEDVIIRFSKENNIHRIRVFNIKSTKAMREIKDKQGKPYRYVATGGNHHIDIFCPIKDNKTLKVKTGKWYAEVITHFDANQKGFEPQWRKDQPTAKLIMRLHINDMIAFDKKDDKGNILREIWRVQKLDGFFEAIFIIPHLDAIDKRSRKASPKQLQEWNARKIAITPAGKVLDSGKAPMPKHLREKEDKEAAA